MAGPFYLAWVAPDTEFDPDVHNRMDEDIFAYSLEGSENNFHSLTLEIADPGVPLLDETRERWAFFSEDDGNGNIVPRFFGRIVAVPNAQDGGELTVSLLARPDDFNDQKAALAATLKSDPQYWDPALIAPESRDDPDAVLAARSASWFCDPVTHEVSISDNIVGTELVVLTADEVYDDNASESYGKPPARRCEVTVELRWTQQAEGVVDVTPFLLEAFSDAGIGIIDNPFVASSYTMNDLIATWPTPGQSLGAGWFVDDSAVSEVRSIETTVRNQTRITLWAPDHTQTTETTDAVVAIDIDLGVFKPKLILGYAAQRAYVEIASFALEAGVQDVVTDDPGADEIIRINLASNDVGEPVDPGGLSPIRDVRRRQFLATDRGHDLMRYAVARARASLLDRARCVTDTAEIDFGRRFEIALTKSAQVPHPKFSGDIAQGKIVGWREAGNGDSGDFSFALTLGCCPGNGGTISAEAGTGVYAADGYMQDGYQQREGTTILVAGDVTFSDYAYTPNDDGVNLLAPWPPDLINAIVITNGPAAQRAALATHFSDVASAEAAYAAKATSVCVDMKPLTGGPFTTEVPITVSDLMVPKQIDLAA